MASDLENVLYKPITTPQEYYTVPSVDGNGCSILDLVSTLNDNRGDILLNIKKVKECYNRRGLKKVAGKRNKDGSVVIPSVSTKIIDEGDFIEMGKFEINRDSATINMRVARRTNLVDRDSGDIIQEVAGILMNNLKDYKQYTVVGDGELNVSSLFVRFSTKSAFKAVQGLGILIGESYSHTEEYEIKLSELPVCGFSSKEATITTDVFDKLAKLNIMGRILTGMSKGKSSEYTPEQVAELKSKCLSDSLYINIPMMTAHDNLDDAIKEGSVDSRTTYKITVGSTDVLSVKKFMSANAFLDRMYIATEFNENDKATDAIKKPKINEVFFNPNVRFSRKTLSARTKVTMADNIQKNIYDEVLGLEEPDFLMEIGSIIGVPELVKLSYRKDLEEDELIDIIERCSDAIASVERDLWASAVSPIVFHIGSTGILPEEMDSVAMTADDLMGKFDKLVLTKAEKDGTFFEVDGIILSIYATKAYFSTGNVAATAAG
jgi:hypothetical protein